jgi:phosphate transport system substrate-binding protein
MMANRDNNFVKPESKSFQSAAANADWAGTPGYNVVLVNQPGQDSWPITGASFILMHKTPANAERALAALKFFEWSFKNGAKLAEDLDYVPMPDAVVTLVGKTWAADIKGGDGKPVWNGQ